MFNNSLARVDAAFEFNVEIMFKSETDAEPLFGYKRVNDAFDQPTDVRNNCCCYCCCYCYCGSGDGIVNKRQNERIRQSPINFWGKLKIHAQRRYGLLLYIYFIPLFVSCNYCIIMVRSLNRFLNNEYGSYLYIRDSAHTYILLCALYLYQCDNLQVDRVLLFMCSHIM